MYNYTFQNRKELRLEFLKLTIEELLEQPEFSSWMLHRTHEKEWELFLAENPEFKFRVIKAKKIFDLLSNRSVNLSDEALLMIWKNIDHYDSQLKGRSQRFSVLSIMRYAAVIVFMLFIGSAGYWAYHSLHQPYIYSTSIGSSGVNQSQLLLSNGMKVDLAKKNSKIAMNGDQKIVIDNEKVIDLSKGDGADDSRMNEVVIPFGKKSQLILEDGTKVWLNAGSRMAFPTRFAGKKREVFLDGEAYFEVAPDKDKPFLVNTSEISIKVLGTRFDVSAYNSDNVTETVLLEGKVSVCDLSVLGILKRETILSPNQKASFDRDAHSITVKNEPDGDFAIAWTEGWFKFSQQSLKDVIAKMQRYYNVQFVFDSDFSTADLISGKLDLKESVGQVMIALSDVANLQFRVDGNKIYIYKKMSELLMRK